MPPTNNLPDELSTGIAPSNETVAEATPPDVTVDQSQTMDTKEETPAVEPTTPTVEASAPEVAAPATPEVAAEQAPATPEAPATEAPAVEAEAPAAPAVEAPVAEAAPVNPLEAALPFLEEQVLLEILSAQSGESRMPNKAEYKAKLALVDKYLDKEAGGITRDAFTKFQKNRDIVEAARSHKRAHEARSKKPAKVAAAPTAAPAVAPATPAVTVGEITVEEIIQLLNAQAGVARIEDKAVYKTLVEKATTAKVLDEKRGGVTAETYGKFKENEAFVKAAKAHREAATLRARAKLDTSSTKKRSR